jgi:DNA-binding GntR family transcriptional regulator
MPVAPDDQEKAATKIYHELRLAILSGALKPGEKLSERRLMEKYSVSRTPAREALKSLEREGLVRALPKSGTVVASLGVREVEEIYQVRLVLEPLALSLAVTRLTDSDRQELDGMIDAMERAVAQGDYMSYLRYDADVHVWIARASGNSLLARMIGDLTGQIVRLGVASIVHPGRPESSLEEHRAMARALKEGRGVDATNTLVVHLSNSRGGALKTMQGGV